MEYSVADRFSLWDTYRAQHPLLNLLHPVLARDLAESATRVIFGTQCSHCARSLLLKAEDAEQATAESLPKWQLFGMETFCCSPVLRVNTICNRT